MKRLLFILYLLFPAIVFSQDEKTVLTEIVPILDSELEDVLKDLQQYPPAQRPFLKYFTSYTLPKELQDVVGGALSFTVHSMSSGLVIEKPIKVTNTLYRIDIRNYNWTQEAWEKSTNEAEPYIRLPWIPEKTYEAIRYQSGNSLVRADWFIVHGLDPQRQIDFGVKELLYYNLQYGKKLVNLKEFQDWWAVDINKIRKFQLERGGVVDTDDSIVSRHHRMLSRTRTEIGYYWESYDDANIDYVEDLKATASGRSAGEIICTNFIGLQTYLLVNGQNNVIDFGDPTFVRDKRDPSDVRVRTGWSCVRCHETGINNINNEIQNVIANNVKLNLSAIDKDSQFRKRFYLSDINSYVTEDQLAYTRTIKEVNGLTPEENLKNLEKIFEFYNKSLTREQAAIECGVPEEVLSEKLRLSTSARLVDLANGGTIPRFVWEQVKNGEYQLAQLYIHNLPFPTAIEDTAPKPKVDPDVVLDQPITKLEQEVIKNPDKEEWNPVIIDFDDIGENIRQGKVIVLEVIATETELRSGNNVISKLKKGQRLQFSGEPINEEQRRYWIEVISDGRKGYVLKNHVIAAAY